MYELQPRRPSEIHPGEHQQEWPQQVQYEKAQTHTTAAWNDSTVNYHHQATRNKWSFGFWDCCSPCGTACLSCWCPCILFGKTYRRTHHNERSPDCCNLMCCAYCSLLPCGGASIMACFTRKATREQFGIDGDGCTDCLAACCCPCCALLQEGKEAIARVEGYDPVTTMGYQTPRKMSYT